jgi:fluoride exporter
MTVIWVGLSVAGAVGAPSRYLLDRFVTDRVGGRFLWGTFVINLSGSLLLGLIVGAALYHALPNTPKVILGTGFCGAYTTFSTWTFETVRLLEDGEFGDALRNAAFSVLASGAAAGLGLAVATL